MSIETEIKKLQAAVVQLTDAIVSASERMGTQTELVSRVTSKPNFKEDHYPVDGRLRSLPEETVEVKAEPFPTFNTREDKFEEPVPTVETPAPTVAAATTPAMPGAVAKRNTGQVPSTVYNQPAKPAKPTQIPPISLSDFGQKLGPLAVKMGDNGAGLRELMKKHNAMHVSQIPEEKRNEFLLAANELAGGGA